MTTDSLQPFVAADKPTRRVASFLKSKFNKATMMVATAAVLASPSAHAADPIERGLTMLVDLFTNKYAVGAGTVAIAWVGYQYLFSKSADKTLMGRVFIGLCIVFGASQLASYAR